MKIKFNPVHIAAFLIIAIALALTAIAVYAQPGTDVDPFISLSYLQAATSLNPVSLEGGEDLEVTGGFGLVLLEGSAKLFPPEDSDAWIVDSTDGQIYVDSVEMTAGHIYIPICSDSSESFALQAMQDSVIGIPGGAGK